MSSRRRRTSARVLIELLQVLANATEIPGARRTSLTAMLSWRLKSVTCTFARRKPPQDAEERIDVVWDVGHRPMAITKRPYRLTIA